MIQSQTTDIFPFSLDVRRAFPYADDLPYF